MVKNNKINWILVIIVLVMFSIMSFFIAGIMGLFIGHSSDFSKGNVAIVKLHGPITISSPSSFGQSNVVSSSNIVSLLNEASKRDNIKAIILDINSGGGSPVASYEIVEAIKKTDKPIISVIREVGASGAYWVASSSNHIIANKMSITGSIGAYTSMFDLSGILGDNNITYNLIKSGKYKDMGSPFKELTPDERFHIQKRLDDIHHFFISEVSEYRNLSYTEVDGLANGLWYLGLEAYDLGLIDEFGGFNEAEIYIENLLNISVQKVNFEISKSIFDSFFSISSENFYFLGRGIGESIGKSENKIML